MNRSVLRQHGVFSSLFAPTPSARTIRDDYECRGPLGAVTVDGDLIVPDDATCTLTRTRVRGNVVVMARATLAATGIEVRGGVQSEGSANVVLRDAKISKDVQVTRAEPGGAVTIHSCRLDGNLQLESNHSPITVEQNRVSGNVQLADNTGGIAISRNRIGNMLHAQDNDPPPTGEANKAKETKGQCERMAAMPPAPTAGP